jgi:psp operon transcriptional activator
MLLARHFAVQMSAELTWDQFPGFGPAALLQLREYHWPGNVRELKNVVERSLHRWGDQESAVETLVIDPFQSPWADADLRSAVALASQAHHRDALTKIDQQPAGSSTPLLHTKGLRDSVDNYEKNLLRASLEQHDFNQRRTAEALGLSYDQLRGLVRKHKLQTSKRDRG